MGLWFGQLARLLKLRKASPLRPVEHDYAVQQKQPEIHEVTTDFGGVRLRSAFEIVEDKPGQISINIEGPFFEFSDGPDGIE
jgi:hypothetical protein